ncbi:MAG: hypothetical protein K2P61_02940 [Burkholderiaceae bacterium]|nr:hypothetical protein [Burkholderiaceae bacterium]
MNALSRRSLKFIDNINKNGEYVEFSSLSLYEIRMPGKYWEGVYLFFSDELVRHKHCSAGLIRLTFADFDSAACQQIGFVWQEY